MVKYLIPSHDIIYPDLLGAGQAVEEQEDCCLDCHGPADGCFLVEPGGGHFVLLELRPLCFTGTEAPLFYWNWGPFVLLKLRPLCSTEVCSCCQWLGDWGTLEAGIGDHSRESVQGITNTLHFEVYILYSLHCTVQRDLYAGVWSQVVHLHWRFWCIIKEQIKIYSTTKAEIKRRVYLVYLNLRPTLMTLFTLRNCIALHWPESSDIIATGLIS